MKRLKLFLLAILMIISSLTFAQNNDKVKVSGFVQGLYQVNAQDEDNVDNSFRMRRVRLSVSGNLNEIISYKIQGDFGSSPMLVDAFVKAKFNDAFAVQFGQFKLPFSIESPINPIDLEAIDYGDAITKLVGYSDVCGQGSLGRDIGIMFTGKFIPMGTDDNKFHLLDYSVGIFNGTGPYKLYNDDKNKVKTENEDNNKEKEFVGRLNIHPIKTVTASASYYTGHYGVDALKRERMGFGAEYNDNKIVARTEYIMGKTGKIKNVYDQTVTDSIIGTEVTSYNSFGMYAVAGYWFDFECGKNAMRLLPFLRYDFFAKDIDAKTGDYGLYTLGFDFRPYKFLSLKMNYQYKQETVFKTGSTSETEYDDTHIFKCMVSFKF